MKRRGRKKKHRKGTKTGGVPLSLLVGHGASQLNTGAEAGRRMRPTAGELAHAARLLADPGEAAEELGCRRA